MQIGECIGKTSRDFLTQKREASLVACKQAGLFRVSMRPASASEENVVRESVLAPFFLASAIL